MDEYAEIFRRLEAAGIETDHDGEQPEESIGELERLMSYPLPTSYRAFVQHYGFGGAADNPYAGIVDSDPTQEVSESAFYQTKLLRGRWRIPEDYLVVHFSYDSELAVCLSLATRDAKNECRVLLVENLGNELDVSLQAESFKEAFGRHMEELISAQ